MKYDIQPETRKSAYNKKLIKNIKHVGDQETNFLIWNIFGKITYWNFLKADIIERKHKLFSKNNRRVDQVWVQLVLICSISKLMMRDYDIQRGVASIPVCCAFTPYH